MNKIKGFFRTLWERLGLRTWPDWRNALHVLTPMFVAILGYLGLDANIAESIGVFVAAALSPALAWWNSTDGIRSWIYGLVIPLQGLLVAFDVVTQEQYASIAAIVLSAITAVLASSNTPTSHTVKDIIGPTVGDKIVEKVAA